LASSLVKRAGVDQKYDQRKLYASVFMSLQLVGVSTKESEVVCDEVTKLVTRFVANGSTITSLELRHFTAKELMSYNQPASYMYMHHRTLS
jgi:transcriptional regulator NrdR family protein